MSDQLFKILALCLVTVIISISLKSKNPEFAFLVVLTGGLVISFLVLKNLASPIKQLTERLTLAGLNQEYFITALKAVGIGYITTFIADTCRDSGHSSLADKAELAGKTACVLLALPMMLSIMETAVSLIK